MVTDNNQIHSTPQPLPIVNKDGDPTLVYVFTGVVHPERATLHLPSHIDIPINHEKACVVGTLRIIICKNQVTATLLCGRAISDFTTARNVIHHNVSMIIDCACLDFTVTYDLEIKQMFNVSNGENIVFFDCIPGITPTLEPPVESNLASLLHVALKEPLFRHATADYRRAVKYADDTGFFCSRARESLIHYFEDLLNLKTDKAASAMCNILNIDEQYLSYLRNISGRNRHGHVEWISGKTRHNAIAITRSLLTRFSIYYNARNQNAENTNPAIFDPLMVDISDS